jgi:hypothetical protein
VAAQLARVTLTTATRATNNQRPLSCPISKHPITYLSRRQIGLMRSLGRRLRKFQRACDRTLEKP